MPARLKRYYGSGYLHFITTSCYQRRSLLDRAARRDLFLEMLEEIRRRYGFVVVGYVVMPEHVHLLIGDEQRPAEMKVRSTHPSKIAMGGAASNRKRSYTA